jgi:hypothetical protein
MGYLYRKDARASCSYNEVSVSWPTFRYMYFDGSTKREISNLGEGYFLPGGCVYMDSSNRHHLTYDCEDNLWNCKY